MRLEAKTPLCARRDTTLNSIRARVVSLCLLPVLLCAACGAPTYNWETRWDAPYGAFDFDGRELLWTVRNDIDVGQLTRAWDELAPLTKRAPLNLEAFVLLQDIELELVKRGLDAPPSAPQDLTQALGSRDAGVALHEMYVTRLREEESLAAFLLAARLERDVVAARRYLSDALAIDSKCAWVHYGLAHLSLRDDEDKNRWRVAQKNLNVALQHDPSHLRARRLEAWMLVQEGSAQSGLPAMEHWLSEVAGDPRIAMRQRQSAQLDLVREHVAQGNLDVARAILLSLEGGRIDRARRFLLLACVEHALGHPDAAMEAAFRAEAAGLGEALPIVHQAMLLEEMDEDPSASQQAWQRVVERATASADVAGLLQVLRARVLLERRELQVIDASELELEPNTAPDAGAERASGPPR
ncbi:MAG: hypothetical protein ACI841_002970 [Planctomycetota bacterium]|jgi:hypothetical protein